MAPPQSPLRKLCLVSNENQNYENSSSDDEENFFDVEQHNAGRRLSFHAIHGSCIKREMGRFRVVRTDDWYCEGLVFSNRPIAIDEKVCIRLSEISNKKKHLCAFRLGVTNVDPASLRDEEFSEYAHRLNKKPGYWVDWMHRRNLSEGNLLEFFVSSSGEIHYSMNGEDQGIFLRDISTDKPLWAIFDVSESVKAIEFCEWSVDDEKWIPSMGWNDEVDGDAQPAHHTRGKRLRFHSIHGESIKREQGRYRVVRVDDSHCDGIVFSNRPISIDERVCLHLTGVTTKKERRVMRLGVTNVDPFLLVNEELPATAVPDINKEPGYWTKWLPNRKLKKSQDACEGNLVQFYVSRDGKIHYNINGENKGIFLSGINTDCPLWVIIDVYGRVKSVEFCEKTFDDKEWNGDDYDDEDADEASEDEDELDPSEGKGWRRRVTKKLTAAAKWIRQVV